MQSSQPSESARRRFHWRHSRAELEPWLADRRFEVEPGGRFLRAGLLIVRPPGVLPIGIDQIPPATPDAAHLARRRLQPPSCALVRYLEQLPAEPQRQCLVLLQAGAAAVGSFEAGEVLATRSLKRYVVRGNGRAQGTHLRRRGKSRYGSRLRLRNAQHLLEELNEKLREHWESFGPAREVFASAPARLWAELWRARTTPPFEPSGAATRLLRVPFDVPVPTTEVLLRTYRRLEHGSIEGPAALLAASAPTVR